MRLTGDGSYKESHANDLSSVLRETDRDSGRDAYLKFVTLQWAAFSSPVENDSGSVMM